MCRLSENPGSLNLLEPWGPVQACTGMVIYGFYLPLSVFTRATCQEISSLYFCRYYMFRPVFQRIGLFLYRSNPGWSIQMFAVVKYPVLHFERWVSDQKKHYTERIVLWRWMFVKPCLQLSAPSLWITNKLCSYATKCLSVLLHYFCMCCEGAYHCCAVLPSAGRDLIKNRMKALSYTQQKFVRCLATYVVETVTMAR